MPSIPAARAGLLALALLTGCASDATSVLVDLSAPAGDQLTALRLQLSIDGAVTSFDLPVGGGPLTLPGTFLLRLPDRGVRVEAFADGTLGDGSHVYAQGLVSCAAFQQTRLPLALAGSGPQGGDGGVHGFGTVGDACAAGIECLSGFCVDGVCCSSACSGGCGVCSTAAGASADGACTPRAGGVVCRASAGACDPAESCDGSRVDCPADALAPSTQVCRSSTSACDPAETCSGTSAMCPADVGTACPIVTWSGPTNGSADLSSVKNLAFTTPGVYTITVGTALTMKVRGAAGGGSGGGGGTNGYGPGAGGGGGAVLTDGVIVMTTMGVSYTLTVGAGGPSTAAGKADGGATSFAGPMKTYLQLGGGAGGPIGGGAGPGGFGGIATIGVGGISGAPGGGATAPGMGGTGACGGGGGGYGDGSSGPGGGGSNGTAAARAGTANGQDGGGHTGGVGGGGGQGVLLLGASGSFGGGGGGVGENWSASSVGGGAGQHGAVVLSFVSAP